MDNFDSPLSRAYALYILIQGLRLQHMRQSQNKPFRRIKRDRLSAMLIGYLQVCTRKERVAANYTLALRALLI